MKKKLILVETEMLGPKGHFLDNLIETTQIFQNKMKIYWFLNKNFNNEGTYIPKNIKILKSISTNKFNRKKHKLFYLIEEIFLFFLNIFQIIYFFYFFLKKNKIRNYYKALRSNYFLIPRYFFSFYKNYKKLNLKPNDHIFFQTARRKDIALINFLSKIDKNHPKFHIRVMLPPKIKFKGFFYFLKELKNQLIDNKLFIYLWSDFNYKLFLKNSDTHKGIFKSNIPWTFYNRKHDKKKITIGYVGDARRARGFQHLPELINILEKKKSFNYLIQFSKIAEDLAETKNKLYLLSKKKKNIKIIEKYCDYNAFRNILKKINIMPIIHSSDEINKVTSGTMYSCIANEIPVVIPSGTIFMKKIMKFKSFEKGGDLKNIASKIIKISNNYEFYLKNVKLNSNILKYILKNDPLRKNIV